MSMMPVERKVALYIEQIGFRLEYHAARDENAIESQKLI